jgi:hypothetical protein
VGTFRFKSDLHNHQAIVQPRLYTYTSTTAGWLRRSLFSGYQYPASLVGPGGFSAATLLLVAWEPQPEYLLMQACRHWRPGPGGTVTIHCGRVVQHQLWGYKCGHLGSDSKLPGVGRLGYAGIVSWVDCRYGCSQSVSMYCDSARCLDLESINFWIRSFRPPRRPRPLGRMLPVTN